MSQLCIAEQTRLLTEIAEEIKTERELSQSTRRGTLPYHKPHNQSAEKSVLF